MQTVIYYFTGTGNSLAVARAVAKRLGNTEVLPIMSLQKNAVVPASYQRVGFCYPTCFLHPPKVVMEIGEKLEVSRSQKIFLIVTCGGYNGFALSDFRAVLQPKTQERIQEFQVRMPGNHIVGFSAWKDSVQQRLFRNSEKKAGVIAKKIQTNAPARVGIPLPVRPMTFLSETYNRHLGVKDIHSTKAEFYVTDACVHCGICERICPVGNIRVLPDRVTFGDNCQQCMACIQWCPHRAIAHPNVPEDRRRYHHPGITLKDMLVK